MNLHPQEEINESFPGKLLKFLKHILIPFTDLCWSIDSYSPNVISSCSVKEEDRIAFDIQKSEWYGERERLMSIFAFKVTIQQT